VIDTKTQPQILFVDDEPDFLQIMTETFGELSKGRWKMHRASSVDAALELLKRQKVDLAVVDINMPMLDGLQFLRILNRRYPGVKKVTLTAYATEDNRAACLANGAEMFIEKPRTVEGFKSVFVILDELASWAPTEGFHGMLRKVGLNDIIQMECLGRNSSVLEISSRQAYGRVFIEDGNIIHAVIGELTGEKALHKLLGVAGGEFKLLPYESPGIRTIEGPWEFLLMESARVRDEMASQPPVEPAPAPTPPPLPPEAAAEAAAPAPAVVPTASIVVKETLVCSEKGTPIYHWQCAEVMNRVSLLQTIAQQATLLGQTLPLGNFDRLEIRQPDRRSVALFGANRMVFITVAKPPHAQ
jgi:CheY-like chemotaxis protein